MLVLENAEELQLHARSMVLSDMAGGHAFRPTAGDRMRYKILHKFHDYKARFKWLSYVCWLWALYIKMPWIYFSNGNSWEDGYGSGGKLKWKEITMNNPIKPIPSTILEIKRESNLEYTFKVATNIKPEHGQFLQLSIPKNWWSTNLCFQPRVRAG